MLQRGILVEGALVVLHTVISIVPRRTGGAVARPGLKRTILVVRIVPQGVLHPVATEMVRYVDTTVVGHVPVVLRLQRKLVLAENRLKVGLYLYTYSYV